MILDTLVIFSAKYLFIAIILIDGIWFLRQPRSKQREFLPYAITALALAFILLKLAGLLYYDPRPFVVGHFTPFIPHAPDNGFPSDHTVLSASLAVLIFPYNRRLGAFLGVLALVIGASRVYAGIHHPVDIITGIIIAIIAGWAAWYCVTKLILKNAIFKKYLS